MAAIPWYHLMLYSGMNHIDFQVFTIPSLLICSGTAIVADYAFMAMSAYFFLESEERPLLPRFLGILAPVLFLYVIKIGVLKGGLHFSEDFSLYKNFFYEGSWWFIKVYLIMLCIYPALNQIIASLSEKYLRLVCCFLGIGFLYQGFIQETGIFEDLWAFVFTYFVIAYLKRGDFQKYLGIQNKKFNMCLIYLAGYILTFAGCLLAKWTDGFISEFAYTDVLTIFIGRYSFLQFLMGIAVFLLFRSMKIRQSSRINAFAKNVFYVFLLHETVMAVFWKFQKLVIVDDVLPWKNMAEFIFWCMVYLLSCFLVAILVRFIYEKTIRKWVEKCIAWAEKLPFMMMWFIFALVLFFSFHDFEVNRINATMMAFSYKYGFVSRGFIGTIYQFLNQIPGIQMYDYHALMVFTQCVTVLYLALLGYLFYLALKKCRKNITKELQGIILFFTIWAVPMFVTEYNFGRLDIYCVMLSVMAAILLIKERAEWLVVIFSAVGVMIHQGNVFMFLNIILVLLLYKAFSAEGRRRRKYLILFVFSFLSASVLFLYFEFFSHMNGAGVYEDLIRIASSLRYDGTYHADVIDKEILGIDLAEREIAFRKNNCIQFPFFLLLMSPYIIIGVRFFKNLLRAANDRMEKCKYLMIACGSVTIVPDLLLKCDYGRWMFSILCYYAVVTIALLGMKDQLFSREIKKISTELTQNRPWMILLLFYPLLLQPLQDVSIIPFTREVARDLNKSILHWW